MQLSNRIIGLIVLFGAVAIVYGTFGFRAVPGQQFGSAFFPRITAGAMALTGLALLLTGPKSSAIAFADWLRSVRGLKAAALPIGGVVWVLVAPSLGFILTTFLLILALILIAGGRVPAAVGVAAGLTLLLYVIFGMLLRIPLPFGVIERLLI